MFSAESRATWSNPPSEHRTAAEDRHASSMRVTVRSGTRRFPVHSTRREPDIANGSPPTSAGSRSTVAAMGVDALGMES